MNKLCRLKMPNKPASYKNGRIAEFMACAYLQAKGYSIVKRNFITGRGTTAGEVDIIASRGNLLAFVEVKKRSNLDKAAYAILPAQQQRIIRGAQSFLQKNPQYETFDLRFDALLISFPCSLRHIENAWTS